MTEFVLQTKLQYPRYTIGFHSVYHWYFQKGGTEILQILSSQPQLFVCIILGALFKNLMTRTLSQDYLRMSIITCNENSSIQTSFKQDSRTSKRAYCRDLLLLVNVFISNNHL